MPFTYQTGEEIKKGDRVTFHGDPGEIEFISDPSVDDPQDWYIKEFGGGVMVIEPDTGPPKRFGRVFITDTADAEDLVLVSRAG
jgi:hypothetical protein